MCCGLHVGQGRDAGAQLCCGAMARAAVVPGTDAQDRATSPWPPGSHQGGKARPGCWRVGQQQEEKVVIAHHDVDQDTACMHMRVRARP